MKKRKPILAIDFDGVLHSYKSGWKGPRRIPDPPVKNAIRWLTELVSSNQFKICIYSSRSKYFLGRSRMRRWLYKNIYSFFENKEIADYKKHGLDYHEAEIDVVMRDLPCEKPSHFVRQSTKLILRKISFPSKKPAAFLTVDDRVFLFRGKFPSNSMIKNFKSWIKSGRF